MAGCAEGTAPYAGEALPAKLGRDAVLGSGSHGCQPPSEGRHGCARETDAQAWFHVGSPAIVPRRLRGVDPRLCGPAFRRVCLYRWSGAPGG